MPDLQTRLPRALAERSLLTRLCEDEIEFHGHRGIPTLLAHPEAGWNDPDSPPTEPRPVVIWMHGRSVSKEIDPGRYLRWLRAPRGGIAACAIDLPGHGERFVEDFQGPVRALEVVDQAAREIDCVVAVLGRPEFRGAFDTARIAIGGMSAGGITTLCRLTRAHAFTCACVEAAAGDFSHMRDRDAFVTCGGRDPKCALAEKLNPIDHLDSWSPIPLLALHSEADQWVPVETIRSFTASLRAHYISRAADPNLIELQTWAETGAWQEHSGFGRFSSEAKNLQTEFLSRHLEGS